MGKILQAKKVSYVFNFFGFGNRQVKKANFETEFTNLVKRTPTITPTELEVNANSVGIPWGLTLILGLLLTLFLSSCAHQGTLRDTWKIDVGMGQNEVMEIMGEPNQKLEDRLLYVIDYNCTQVPFYVNLKHSFVKSFGVKDEVLDHADKGCRENEDDRRAHVAERQRTSQMLMQSYWSHEQPTEMGRRLEPLMKNCWEDAAGWHCM